jgi:predicted nicotinamide N-methyase
MLLEYLREQPIDMNLNVMDIGCGWGLTGIYCAKHFASNVTLVDADCRVFPYVERHEHLNEVSVKTLHREFGELNKADFHQCDVVIGSDICFWPELTNDLKALLQIAQSSGVQRVVLADPGRPTFMKLVEFSQQNFNCSVKSMSFGGKTKQQGYVLSIDN